MLPGYGVVGCGVLKHNVMTNVSSQLYVCLCCVNTVKEFSFIDHRMSYRHLVRMDVGMEWRFIVYMERKV